MNTQELVPIASGLLLGSLLGLLHPSLRWRVGLIMAIALGVLATVVSGEFRLSWAFLLVDIPLVALSAAAALTAVHHLVFSRKRRG